MTARRLMVPSGSVAASNAAEAIASTNPKIKFTLPDTGDPLIAKIRPSLPPAAQLVVDPAGNGDATTFDDAIKMVDDARSTAMAIGNATAASPLFRVDIGLMPGAYTLSNAGGTLKQHIGVYALDPTKGKTVCNWGIEPSGWLYWEGVDITNVDNNGAFDPKYAVHLHAFGTTIFARSTFTNNAPKAGGFPTPIGMDGWDQQATILLHDLNMTTGNYTNLHGGSWTAGQPGMNVIFNKVNYPGGAAFFDSLTDPYTCDLWVQGGCNLAGVGLWGASNNLHVSPDTVINTSAGDPNRNTRKADTSGATITGTSDQRTDWPIPTGGLSARDKATYGVTA